jgi:hypothetical protein
MNNDFIEFKSISAEEKTKLPSLSFLRVELTREPTLSTFILRASTPNEDRTGTVTTVSILGEPTMAKADVAVKVAKLIASGMGKKKDSTFKWENLDAPDLARMLLPSLKFFCTTARVQSVQFSTDALKAVKSAE